MAVVSCSIEEINNPEKETINRLSGSKYYAIIEEQPGNVDTKTYADSQLRVLWNEDDHVTIFDKKTLNEEFCFDGEDGDNSGGFYPAPSSGGYVSYSDLTYACSVYPYQRSTKISYDGIVTFTLPAEQTYAPNSFGRGANTMIAKTETNQLKFKNVGGYLSFKLYGQGVSVTSIDLKGNNGEPLAGKCTISMESGDPVTTMASSNTSDQITLICSPSVELSSSSASPTEFWIVVPPTTFSQGITFTVHTSDGGVFERSSSASFTLGRNKKMQIPAMEVEVIEPTEFDIVSEYAQQGINSISYDFVSHLVYEPESSSYDLPVIDPTNGGSIRYTIPNGTVWRFNQSIIQDGDQQAYNAQLVPSTDKISYTVPNTISSVIDVVWEMVGSINGEALPLYGSWFPRLREVSMQNGNQVQVTYSIDNPEFILEGNIQLAATTGPTERLLSDCLALNSEGYWIDHLAFDSDNAFETNNDCSLGSNLSKDLYLNAASAILEAPSIPVLYNGGPLDLQSIFEIHCQNEIDYQLFTYSSEDFFTKYPELSLNFEIVPYTIGGNVTDESMYGRIDGSLFTPCYVGSVSGNAVSYPIEVGSETGISSVGRMPLILVTLVNNNTGAVCAYGYFKIIITKENDTTIDSSTKFFVIPDLGKVPYICSTYAMVTKWHEFSYYVLEGLGVDYALFTTAYEFTDIYAYVPNANGGTTFQSIVNGNVSEGINLPIRYSLNGQTYDLGTAKYAKDASGSGVNDAFTWNVNPRGVGESCCRDIYFRFESAFDIVYIQLRADVAARANMLFASNKIASSWFSDIYQEAYNTVRMNTPAPSSTSNVMDFQVNLYTLFQDNYPALALDPSSDPVYSSILGNQWDPLRPELISTTTSFQFSVEQPKINNIQLFVKFWRDYSVNGDTEDYTKLYAVKYLNNMPSTQTIEDRSGNQVQVYSIYESQLIATIVNTNGTDILRYADTDIAKNILNYWCGEETYQSKMFYCNITSKNSYGYCNILLNDSQFHVRFIRPLDFAFNAQNATYEPNSDGCNVEIMKFISSITDWNNIPVIVPQYEQGVWTGYFEENITPSGNIYKYYGFRRLRINVGAAERDNWNPNNPSQFGRLNTVTPNAQLTLGTVNAGEVFAAMPSLSTVSITDFGALRPIVLNYRDNNSSTENFTIRIPFEIEYAWGTLSGTFIIHFSCSQVD